MKKIPLYILLAATVFSCIPARQVEEIKTKYEKCDSERQALSSENMTLETTNNELKAYNEKLLKAQTSLIKDTTVLGTSLRKMTKQYDKINELNDELLRKQADLTKGSENENRKLLQELQLLQLDLQKREDQLKDAEMELGIKKLKLERLSLDLENAGVELRKREKRVVELEEMIAQKDAAVRALKDKITEALLGFKDKGLTVEQKNGKIYVSMEAKLLFAKGSTVVDPNGKKVLVDLAKVLQDQSDLQILIEGHTDSDKLSGTGAIKDNWDLSVMRATSVARIMLENSTLNAQNVTPAGRGEFSPVDSADTEEAKSKNRRIEIILTPNLDALFEIIEKEQN
jgi:chemotaxis protein MotB